MSTLVWSRYDFIRSLLIRDFSSPAAVVELGAAPGDQAVGLAQAGFHVTAVDLGTSSDAWADAAEGRMDRMFADANVAYVQWDLETAPYPFEDAAFDAVVFTEVYEHLRDYPIRSLLEARRILRSGGRLYFTTPNAAYLVNRLRLLMGRSVATRLEDWIGGEPYARHAREYTCGEIETLMAHAGFEIVEMLGREFYLGSGPKRLVKEAINKLAMIRPSLGPLIICVAERP